MKFEFIVVQAIGVLIEVIVTYSYFEALLSCDKMNRRFGKKSILFYIIMFIVLTIIQCVTNDMIIVPLSMAVAILFVSMAYVGEWKNKVSLSVILLLIFILSELGMGMIMSMLSQNSMQGMEDNLLKYFQGMFVSKMVAFIIVKIIARIKNRHIYSLNIKSWLGIMLIPTASIISLYAVVEIAYTLNDLKNNMYVLLVAICLIGANVMAFSLFENELKVEEQKLRYKFLKRQLNDEKDYYNTLAETQNEIKKTSHDLKNSLIAILGSIEDGNLSSAKAKIKKMINISNNSLQTVYTGQIVVDTMLNTKYKRMIKSNITFRPLCIMSDEKNFDYVNFCIFLGNALDNAIEACEKLPNERYINLKIIEKESVLLCYIVNSFDENVLKVNEKTSKSNKLLHGFGLDNMKAIVNENGGSLNVKSVGNKYIVSALFKI